MTDNSPAVQAVIDLEARLATVTAERDRLIEQREDAGSRFGSSDHFAAKWFGDLRRAQRSSASAQQSLAELAQKVADQARSLLSVKDDEHRWDNSDIQDTARELLRDARSAFPYIDS